MPCFPLFRVLTAASVFLVIKILVGYQEYLLATDCHETYRNYIIQDDSSLSNLTEVGQLIQRYQGCTSRTRGTEVTPSMTGTAHTHTYAHKHCLAYILVVIKLLQWYLLTFTKCSGCMLIQSYINCKLTYRSISDLKQRTMAVGGE